MLHRKRHISSQNGFTLTEMIIVIALMAILSTVVLTNYSSFENKQVLKNLTQDVALSLRLAQSYGLFVRSEGSGDFEVSYGVHFKKGTPTEYLIYKDSDRSVGGYKYTAGNKVQGYTLGEGYKIKNVCAEEAISGDSYCFSGVPGPRRINQLDITFDRPRPDAHFRSKKGADIKTDYVNAEVTIQNPDGDEKSVKILITGYIGVP